MAEKPVIYIKKTCAWCVEALDYFKSKGLSLEIKDINENEVWRAELKGVSGQTGVPTFVYGDFVVSDFGVDEFVEALKKEPGVKKKLGL